MYSLKVKKALAKTLRREIYHLKRMIIFGFEYSTFLRLSSARVKHLKNLKDNL